MQIADLHYSVNVGSCRDTTISPCTGSDNLTNTLLGHVLDVEKPDMVVFTGDQLNGQGSTWDARSVLAKFAKAVTERGIPWAAVFGNHDDSISGTLPSGTFPLSSLYGGSFKFTTFTLPFANYALKLALTNNMRRISEFVARVLGPKVIADSGEWGTYAWSAFVLGVPGMRIAGGSDEVMRNIVAERVLGLPKDPGIDVVTPFRDLKVGTQKA